MYVILMFADQVDLILDHADVNNDGYLGYFEYIYERRTCEQLKGKAKEKGNLK